MKLTCRFNAGVASDDSIAAGHDAVTATNGCASDRSNANGVKDLDLALQVALSNSQGEQEVACVCLIPHSMRKETNILCLSAS